MALIKEEGGTQVMIEIKNLKVSIGKQEIVHEFSAEFHKGSVNVFLGPNGSGKSTIIRSIIHLTEVTGGEIIVDGKNISEYTAKELAQKIAYMPQNRNVSDISVKRLVLHGRFPYLSYPRKYRKQDMEIVDRILKDLKIEKLANRSLSQLSGGQRQKVYLAMALAQETDTIMMDEPANFLDIKSQLEVISMVRNLANAGKNVIMVLHDFESALRCADNIFLLYEGNLIKTGSPEEVLTSREVEEIFGVEVKIIKDDDGNHCYYKKK